MAKVTLTNITSGYASTDDLNTNFQTIADAFENTLSLDGTTPNQMTANLDANGYAVINQPSTSGGDALVYAGDWLVDTTYAVDNIVTVPVSQGHTANGTYICILAHQSDASDFDTDLALGTLWRVMAEQGPAGTGSGDLLAANNLSEAGLTPATVRTNLVVLEDVHTTRGDITVEGASGPIRMELVDEGAHYGSDGTDVAEKYGIWEHIETKDFSTNTQLEFFHDGIDANGSLDLVDGWDYRIEYENIYGTVSAAYCTVHCYEDGGYLTTAADYYYSAIYGGTSNGAAAGTTLDGAQTFGFVGPSWGTSSTSGQAQGWIWVKNPANARPVFMEYAYSAWHSTHVNYYGWNRRWALPHNPCTKFKLTSTSGTFTGHLRYYRRYTP